jgi:hypothetical protein
VRKELIHIFVHGLRYLPILRKGLPKEVFSKYPYVRRPFTEGRNPDRDHCEPVIEVLPESSSFHLVAKIPIGRCHDPAIGFS